MSISVGSSEGPGLWKRTQSRTFAPVVLSVHLSTILLSAPLPSLGRARCGHAEQGVANGSTRETL